MDTTIGQKLAQQKTGSTQSRWQRLTTLSVVAKEIDVMNDMLERRRFERVPKMPSMDEDDEYSHH